MMRQKQQTTANTCFATAPGFATFASAKPPANVIYPQPISSPAPHPNKPIFTVRGNIPNWMLSRLKKEYKKGLSITPDTNENEENATPLPIFETDWSKDIESKTTPGDNMKMYRENLGLSQAALGDKLGNVPRQNVSLMENGKRGISKETAKKLSKLFKAPVSRFI